MGRWHFPGVGRLQCFDRFLMADLERRAAAKGMAKEVRAVLQMEGGGYNATPRDVALWREGWRTQPGRFLMDWYSGVLLRHAADVLSWVRGAVETDVDVTMKLAGVHWWWFSCSRAAEATAGYVKGGGKSVYEDLCALLKEHNVVLDLTCLEMRTIDSPFWSGGCGPRQLVDEVFSAAQRAGVRVAGENAIEGFEDFKFQQIVSSFSRWRGQGAAFTLLRLGPGLLEESNMRRFEQFVANMNKAG